MNEFFTKKNAGRVFHGKLTSIFCCIVALLCFTEKSAASINRDVDLFNSPMAYQADSLVKGKVIDDKGMPLPGVSVKLKGTQTGTMTLNDGSFTLKAPGNGILVFSFIGYTEQEIAVNNRESIEVKLLEGKNDLDEVVVTGYSSQRKKDIIGAVSVVSLKDLQQTPSPNLAAQLQGRAAGVVVSTSGNPGSNAGIRIRGFASYGNNNPLYVIDGVATTDIARINSDDIESLQVLKDASSASIYGARAANGVIIITTKHGKAGNTKVSYNSYLGFQEIPDRSIPKMLNPEGIMKYLTLTQNSSYVDPVFGKYGSFALPDFYIVSNNFKGGVSASDPRANPDLYTIADYNNIYQIFKPTAEGTNWFKEMTQKAMTQNHQISASGGNDKADFYLGLNYLKQDGTFKYTGYERYSIRANSSFKPTSYLTIGENVQVGFDSRKGNLSILGEGNAWTSAFRSSSFVPVRDIKGGWGGSLIGGTAGNGPNPVAGLYRSKDFNERSVRVAGNVFANLNFTKDLFARTSFGIDATLGDYQRQNLKQYEQPEANRTTSYNTGSTYTHNWIWTNTLNFKKTIAVDHDIQALLGTEAVKNTSSGINAYKARYDFESIPFITLNTGLPQSLADISATDSRNVVTINSYFARLDYTFKGRYLLNATIRQDGASVFGPNVQKGYFPAAGIGWRVSDESFFKKITWVNDLKLRAGWGQMGSISNVPSINQYSTYKSSVGENNYDIGGTNTSSTQGFGIATQGNANTKWETTETFNAGLDLSAFDDKWTLSVDVYSKNTRDLLVPSLLNGLEINVAKPLVNLGTMNNKGIDVALSNRGTIAGDLKYNATLTFTHYKNKITKLNDENSVQLVGAGRLANVSYTAKGYPVSSFYGYKIDGFYNNQSDVDNGVKINGQPGQIGTWKYKDLDGDHNITPADAGVIGSPHPSFQAGFNLDLNWKNFDFSTFLFWNYGNQLFNYTKYFTYMGILGGGIAEGKLATAWTPETASTAKTPMVGQGTQNGYTSFVTSNPSSFYVESGSYLRVKTLQLGYTVPNQLINKAKISNLRFYVQAQNLFTVTKYSGGDPDLGLISGNGTDQSIGIDLAGYPNPKQFILGLTLNF